MGEENENYLSDFKYTVPVKAAILIMVKCMLSVRDYEKLKEALDDYLDLPGYSQIKECKKEMMPTVEDPIDFIMDEKNVGKFWPPLKLLQCVIENILKTFHGKSPSNVPNEIYVRGGIGGDGFSGRDSYKILENFSFKL